MLGVSVGGEEVFILGRKLVGRVLRGELEVRLLVGSQRDEPIIWIMWCAKITRTRAV